MRKLNLTMRIARACALLALCLAFLSPVAAQVTTGSLQGVVLDPNKAAVAGATVRITNAETGIVRETQTNEEGFYRVTNLVPGTRYVVEVTAQGFAPAKVENITVRIATENSADISLGLAATTEQVTVTGETGIINTTQNQLSQTYTPTQLTQLPYAGSIDNLALLTPGVATPGDTDFTNGVGISANGNRARSNNFQIDGQDNNDNSVSGPALGFTNNEAIGEYQVITNNFSAEFGRNSGAQVNVVTKSGTNELHGSAFEYHQNSALDARNNTDKRSQAAYNFLAQNGFSQFAGLADRFPNPYRDNRFGGSLGGPIKKNKAFFFATYQRDVNRGEAIIDNLASGTYTLSAESATLAAARFPNRATTDLTSTGRPGGPAFAQGGGTFLLAPPVEDQNGDGVPDAFTFGPGGSAGLTTPGFLAPLAVIRDANGNLQTLYGGEVVRVRQNNSQGDQFITRVDYNLTSRDSIVGRLILDRNLFPLQAGGSSVAGSRLDYRDRTRNFGLTYTRTVSANFVNEARFNLSNLFVTFGNTSANTIPSIAFSTGSGRNLSGGLNLGFGTDASFPQSRRVRVYQLQDTVSQTIGNHAVKYGADVRFQRVNDFFLPFFLGGFTFRSGGALPANTFFNLSGTPRTTATQLENFLLGRPQTVNFTLGDPRSQKKQNDYFFFVQDDWRVRPNLTLNLGLRYEVSTQPLNPLIDQLVARESNSATALFNTAFPLETRTLQKLPIDKNNFGPRVGFNWSPNFNFLGGRFRDGRTVIRGGFGIAYDPGFFNIVSNTITSSPFVGRGSFVQTPGAAGSVTYPFLPTTTAQLNQTPGTNGGDPRLFSRTLVGDDFHNPYTMSYNFGVQQQLFHNGVLEVRYVGSRIVGQFQTVDANPQLRFLNIAGQYLAGDPGRFTAGNISGSCVGTGDPTCITPSAANNFQSRTTDATGSRILGSGRLDPTHGFTLARINGATSTYNGLQMRFDTRLSNSFVVQANYSLSKTIDNASEVFATLAGGQSVAISQNPFDRTNGERGLSAFHQKHIFTSDFVYELPFFKEQRGLIGKLLGGYQLNGIIRLGSGRPYTPVEVFGYDPTASAVNSPLRPFNGDPNAPNGTIAFGYNAACNFLFGGPVCDQANAVPGTFIVYNTLQAGSTGTVVSAAQVRQSARLIYNDFALVPQGLPLADAEAFNLFRTPYGDVGRNSFTGLPTYTVNASIFKTTRLTENTKLEFRAEAFNLLNRRNYGVPDAITEDASNGTFVSTFQNPGYNIGSARTLRFGLRLIF